MRVLGKALTVVLALIFCTAFAAYGWESGYEARHSTAGSDSLASQANVEIHMDEDHPYVYQWRDKKKIFHKEGNYWVIDELPRGIIFTVPEGYKARCISFHTKVVKGKAGKTLDNGRVIYSAGTNVKYTYPSFLQLYKNP